MTLSKQIEDLVLKLNSSLYLKARIKLAALFTIIVAAIVIVFSLLIYFNLKSTIESEVQDEINPINKTSVVERVTDKTRNEIIIIDISIIAFTSLFTFWIAGKTLRPIKENNEIQTLFFSNASHELKTPISIMKADLEITLKKNENNQPEKLKSLIEETDRMNEIVIDLLTLSKINTKKEIKNYNSDVLKLCKETSNLIEPYAEQKNISIKVISNSDRTIVNIDNKEFQHVISNVLKNAIEYSNRNSEIVITLNHQGNKIVISIEDKGIGIPQADLQKVFDRFYRSDFSRSRKTGGSGLGLSISQAIVRNYNGSIAIESKVKEGTKVLITLPLI